MSVDQSINQSSIKQPSRSCQQVHGSASGKHLNSGTQTTGHRDRRLRRASERRPVPRDSRRAGAGRIGRRTTPRKQERVLPQSRRKSKKNCPPSQPISSRTKKQRRDPSYCTNLHLARWRGVLNKENVDAGSRACRWFSWLPTIPSRRGRTLHSRPGGPLHCTALHCNSTRSVHYTSLLPSRSGTHSSPQLPAAQNPPIDDRDDAPLCLSSKKKESHVPEYAMHLAENSNHPHNPDRPDRKQNSIALGYLSPRANASAPHPAPHRPVVVPPFSRASAMLPH